MNEQSNQGEFSQSATALAFFGAITASVSHELSNVISIVDQNAGLLDDLLKNPDMLTQDRLERMASSIAAQTERGVAIIKRLNTFAHTADEDRGEFEINAITENLAELVRRLADRKRVTLAVSPASISITQSGNPFAFQETLFACYRAILDQLEAGDAIRIVVGNDEDAPEVRVECDRGQLGDRLDLTRVEQLTCLTGMRFAVETDDDSTAIALHISG